MRLGGAAVLAAALLVTLFAAAIAMADPPSNDNRADAQTIAIPSTTKGTTAEATNETSEPFACNGGVSTVWYRVNATARGTLNVGLKADGELDATLEVFRARRSQLTSLACEQTDENGETNISARVSADETLFVRVAQTPQSVPGTFTVELQFEAPTPSAPGRALPARGASGTLDPVLRPLAAYSKRLTAGRPYRINLDSGGDEECRTLQVFPPGTNDFESDSSQFTVGCEGYRIFTPGPGDGGRYSFVVSANRDTRQTQPYRLQVLPAAGDDVDPGIFIRNHARVKGSVSARTADVLDLYRFDVTRRSDLDLVLETNGALDLELLRDSGGRLRCDCDGEGGARIRSRLRRGRYYAIVRAQRGGGGSYTLRRVSRTITRTAVAINGRRRSTVRPGRTVNIGVNVSPNVTGPVAIVVYRYDPIEGWRFTKSFRRRAVNGRASVPFQLPSVGRWRARARFYGTRDASESRTGRYAFVTAANPLQQKR